MVLAFLYDYVLTQVDRLRHADNPGEWDSKPDSPLQFGRPPEAAVVKEYTNTFLDYEKSKEEGQDLVDAIDLVLQTLASPAIDASVLSSEQRIREQTVRIRSMCAQLTKLNSRRIERRDQRYDLFVKNLSIDDSISVKRLTILAAVFLPLSLASSILSMQTRFVHLHLLLYDFLGVFLLVASFAILIYLVLRGFTVLSRRDEWQRKEYRPWKSPSRWWSSKATTAEFDTYFKYLMQYALGFSVWAVTMVSFIVGMTVKVTLGLKILGYGLAALTGTSLLLGSLILCWIIFYELPELHERMKHD